MALTLLVALLTAGASGWTFVAATSLLLAVLLLAHPRRPPGGE